MSADWGYATAVVVRTPGQIGRGPRRVSHRFPYDFLRGAGGGPRGLLVWLRCAVRV